MTHDAPDMTESERLRAALTAAAAGEAEQRRRADKYEAAHLAVAYELGAERDPDVGVVQAALEARLREREEARAEVERLQESIDRGWVRGVDIDGKGDLDYYDAAIGLGQRVDDQRARAERAEAHPAAEAVPECVRTALKEWRDEYHNANTDHVFNQLDRNPIRMSRLVNQLLHWLATARLAAIAAATSEDAEAIEAIRNAAEDAHEKPHTVMASLREWKAFTRATIHAGPVVALDVVRPLVEAANVTIMYWEQEACAISLGMRGALVALRAAFAAFPPELRDESEDGDE